MKKTEYYEDKLLLNGVVIIVAYLSILIAAFKYIFDLANIHNQQIQIVLLSIISFIIMSTSVFKSSSNDVVKDKLTFSIVYFFGVGLFAMTIIDKPDYLSENMSKGIFFGYIFLLYIVIAGLKQFEERHKITKMFDDDD